MTQNWLSWCCLSSDSETISWKNLVRAGFTVWAKVIPNSSGARKPDSTTRSCAVLPKPAVIFSITYYHLLGEWYQCLCSAFPAGWLDEFQISIDIDILIFWCFFLPAADEKNRGISMRKREFCIKINLRRTQIWTSEKNIVIKPAAAIFLRII